MSRWDVPLSWQQLWLYRHRVVVRLFCFVGVAACVGLAAWRVLSGRGADAALVPLLSTSGFVLGLIVMRETVRAVEHGDPAEE